MRVDLLLAIGPKNIETNQIAVHVTWTRASIYFELAGLHAPLDRVDYRPTAKTGVTH
jgi:hypothetical protein